MKKYILTFAALSLVACSKSDPEAMEQGIAFNTVESAQYDTIVFNAASSTKTYLNQTGQNVFNCAWNDDESFRVYSDADGYSAAETFVNETGTSIFSGQVPKGTTDMYAVYAAVEPRNPSCSEGLFKATVTIPLEQKAVRADNFDPSAHFGLAHCTRVVGTTTPVSLQFTTLNRFIKVTVPEHTSSVTLSSASAISGSVTMSCDADGKVALASVPQSKSVTLVPASGSTIAAGAYYLCVAPVDIEGFTMEYSFDDGSTYTKASEKTLSMASDPTIRNLSLDFGTIAKPSVSISGFYTSYNYGVGEETSKNITTANNMSSGAFVDGNVSYTEGTGWSQTTKYYSLDGVKNDFASGFTVSGMGTYKIKGIMSFGGVECQSGELTRYITGLPYTANPPSSGEWSNASWNVSFNGDNVQLGAVSGSGDPSITKDRNFVMPKTTDVTVGISYRLKTYRFIGYIRTTFSCSIGDTTIFSETSPSSNSSETSTKTASISTTLANDQAIKLSSSYAAAGPYAKIYTFKVLYR